MKKKKKNWTLEIIAVLIIKFEWTVRFLFDLGLPCLSDLSVQILVRIITVHYTIDDKYVSIRISENRFLHWKIHALYGAILTSSTVPAPRQANLVLITYASSEGSGEPAHPRSLARTSAARSYKQIPGPSEWLGMCSYNLSWRNAGRHKFTWRGSPDVDELKECRRLHVKDFIIMKSGVKLFKTNDVVS